MDDERPDPETDEPDHEVPADLIELFEILEWQATVGPDQLPDLSDDGHG